LGENHAFSKPGKRPLFFNSLENTPFAPERRKTELAAIGESCVRIGSRLSIEKRALAYNLALAAAEALYENYSSYGIRNIRTIRARSSRSPRNWIENSDFKRAFALAQLRKS